MQGKDKANFECQYYINTKTIYHTMTRSGPIYLLLLDLEAHLRMTLYSDYSHNWTNVKQHLKSGTTIAIEITKQEHLDDLYAHATNDIACENQAKDVLLL
jgi:hypothetical protein